MKLMNWMNGFGPVAAGIIVTALLFLVQLAAATKTGDRADNCPEYGPEPCPCSIWEGPDCES